MWSVSSSLKVSWELLALLNVNAFLINHQKDQSLLLGKIGTVCET